MFPSQKDPSQASLPASFFWLRESTATAYPSTDNILAGPQRGGSNLSGKTRRCPALPPAQQEAPAVLTHSTPWMEALPPSAPKRPSCLRTAMLCNPAGSSDLTAACSKQCQLPAAKAGPASRVTTLPAPRPPEQEGNPHRIPRPRASVFL